jgi:gamma-glutamyltranspeptidase
LEHAKSNLGPLSAPLYLARTEDGVFVSTEAPGGADDEAIVLQLLAEANARGENVSPAVRAPNNAHAVLSVDPRFPKNLKSGDVARVVRSLKASGRVVDETYRKDRQDRQRLRVVGEVGAPEKTGEEF